MLEVLTDFVAQLKAAGVAISPQEEIDAAGAIVVLPLDDRESLRSALSATLLKSSEQRDVFATTFDIFFSRRAAPKITGADDEPTGEIDEQQRGKGVYERTMGIEGHAISEVVREALRQGDERALREAARLSVELFAGIESGRPVGASYYLFRTLRSLNLDAIVAGLVAHVGDDDAPPASLRFNRSLGALAARFAAEEYERRAKEFRALVEAAVIEALVDERGVEAVVTSLRRTAIADVEFMHATREELAAIRRSLAPLARLLAARLARRRRHRHRGPLDFRATIRRSLSTGGVPIEPRFSSPHPAKPELVVIADVSGSVASFARFTIQLLHAIAAQFSKVQSFVFVDGLDDVTAIFRHASSLPEAVDRIAREADVTHHDGHSDYGHALSIFRDRYLRSVNGRSDVIILGDGRNNYHPSGSEHLAEIRRRARHVYWLNPEPRAYWDSGDSIIGTYAHLCDGVFECRNLGQLEVFVSSLS